MTTRERLNMWLLVVAVAMTASVGLGNIAAWSPRMISSLASGTVSATEGGGDFAMFWTAGELASQSRWDDVYSLEGLAEVMGEPVGTVSFAYPPPFATVLRPLTELGYADALMVWLLLSVIVVPVVLFAEGRAGGLALLAMAFPAYVALRFGQVAPIAVTVVILAGLALRSGRQFNAGMLLGLLCLKPQFLVGPVIVLLATPSLRRMTLSGMAATAGSVISVSALVTPDAWQAYVEGLFEVLTPGVSTRWDFSIGALTRGWPSIPAGIVSLGLAVVLVVVVVRNVSRSDNAAEKLAIGLCLSLLLSPRVVNYDWTLLIPAVAWLIPTIPLGSPLVPFGAVVILASLSGYVGLSWIAWTSLAAFVVKWSFVQARTEAIVGYPSSPWQRPS